jgi:hypothetical protein
LPGSAAPIASFSERGGDLLDVVRPGLECALRATAACGRLARALAANPPPGTAVVLLDHYGEIERSSLDAERWLGEHFGGARARGLAARNRAGWLVLPPRPPLVSMRDGRRLTVNLVPVIRTALLLEEGVASFRPDALDRLGLTRARPRCSVPPPTWRTKRTSRGSCHSACMQSGTGSRAWKPSSMRTASQAVDRALREST